MPRYPDKQSPTTDPNLNPEPPIFLTQRLTADTIHVPTPIQVQSAKLRINSGPNSGEKTFSDIRPPWSA